EGAARVDEIDTWLVVGLRDFLRAKMLLDRYWVVRAALDRRVIGDNHAFCAADAADAGDDAGAWGFVVVHAIGGQRAQLDERGGRVKQAIDTFADRQFAALAVAGNRAFVAAGAALGQRPGASAQLVDQCLHSGAVGTRIFTRWIDT